MHWLGNLIWRPAFAPAVGAGGEITIASGAGSERRRRDGRAFWQRLFGGNGRTRPGGWPLSAMSRHVLRDIGLTPQMARLKGVSVDWRP